MQFVVRAVSLSLCLDSLSLLSIHHSDSLCLTLSVCLPSLRRWCSAMVV
jgi:hypothetical protein